MSVKTKVVYSIRIHLITFTASLVTDHLVLANTSAQGTVCFVFVVLCVLFLLSAGPFSMQQKLVLCVS